MAELGILLVGAEASAIELPPGVEFAKIDTERAFGDPSGGASMLAGADADRWRLVPASERGGHAGMLSAVAQVAASGLERITADWEAVLVVARVGETALIPCVRALGSSLPVTVLLFGSVRAGDSEARRNHVVLADLLRRRAIAGALHAERAEAGLAPAMDAARAPTVTEIPRRKSVDVGSPLGLPPAPVTPAPAITIPSIEYLPLGWSAELSAVLVDLAAHEALRELLGGPPVDAAGRGVADLDALRRRLPSGDVFEQTRDRVHRALSAVEFVGEDPLVEAIANALRPTVAWAREVVEVTEEIALARMVALRSFGAAGIEFTVQRLRAGLDEVTEERPVTPASELRALLEGEMGEGGPSSIAWRTMFAGVPCKVVSRGEPGWRAARELVKDRFARFRGEYAAAVARSIEERVAEGRDPAAPLPRAELRVLHDRAVRARDVLRQAQLEVNSRILARCERIIRQDALVGWAFPDAARLRTAIEGQLHRHAVRAEIERAATVALSRRPLGMADDADFATWIDELRDASRSLVGQATAVPTYGAVLVGLLEGRDPAALRQGLIGHAIDPVWGLPPDAPPELVQWARSSGMRVEVRPGDSGVSWWTEAVGLSAPSAESGRAGIEEHRLADLAAPPPEGDSVEALAAWVEAISLVLLGTALGVLELRGEGGVRALVVSGPGLPALAFLPHGALHALVADGPGRAELAGRVALALEAIPESVHAAEVLQKLTELAELGPSEHVQVQIGLDLPRYRALVPPALALVRRAARRATAAMIDHLRADEVRVLVTRPSRHGISGLAQLAPSGEL